MHWTGTKAIPLKTQSYLASQQGLPVSSSMEQSGTIRTAFPFAITTASEVKSSTSVTNHNEALAVPNSNDNTLKNVHTGANSDKVYLVEIFFFCNKLLHPYSYFYIPHTITI